MSKTCQECQATLQTLCEFDDTLLEQLRSPVGRLAVRARIPLRAGRGAAAAEASRSVTASDADAGVPDELPAVLAQLREYQVLGFVKEGGMGSVYRAFQTRLGRTVAIKLLLKQRMSDPKARARFEREIQLVGRLRHPNIVQAYDAREIDGTLLLVMEFLEGLNLGDVLRNSGCTSRGRCLRTGAPSRAGFEPRAHARAHPPRCETVESHARPSRVKSRSSTSDWRGCEPTTRPAVRRPPRDS